MSVDAVAARAGVSKPTVYLRHRTKAALATAAIASMRTQPRPKPTADVRADLIAHLRLLRAGLERPNGMAMFGTVLAEEGETPSCSRCSVSAWWRRAGASCAPSWRLRATAATCAPTPTWRWPSAPSSAPSSPATWPGDSFGGRFVATLVDTVLDGLRG